MDGPAARDPALRTGIGRLSARVIALTENDQFSDAIDRQESPCGTQRPHRAKAYLAGGKRTLKSFCNAKPTPLRIEFDRRVLNVAKHLALGLRPALGLIQPDPMNCRDGVVDD